MDNQNASSGEKDPTKTISTASGMKLKTMEEDILTLLENGRESLVILAAGELGTASWMAREIIERATRKGLCSDSLWVSVTEKYHSPLQIYKAIYNQLSSASIPEEWDYDYEDENTQLEMSQQGLNVTTVDWEQEECGNKEEEVAEETADNLKLKLQAQLQKRKTVLLLVLDCEGTNMDHGEFEQNISPMLSSIKHENLKIIITRCKTGGGDAIQEQIVEPIELGPLSPDDSLTLLKKSVDEQIPDFEQLSGPIKEQTSMHWPAAITVIAGALNCIPRNGNEALTLKDGILKAAYYKKPSQGGVNPLLYCAYNMIQSDVTKNCFWHSLEFVRNYGGVNYNELITHWIMEGYFNPFDHIEKAYQAGHLVLMELIDRAMLKMQENNIVVLEGAALNMIDTRPLGFGGTASLGLVHVFENGEGLGRVTHINGRITTLCNPKKVTDVSTLLIDREVVHDKFFNSMPGLKVLAVFNSINKPLMISSLSGSKELRALVLRNCDLLDDTSAIGNLRTLRALEISDSPLMSLPEKLLDGMTHLGSLNLSGLQIEELPSLSNLSELRLLILRRCSRLRKLQSLKGLGKLELLDLSGAESFDNFHDTDFSEIPKIQLIDFSHTKIRKLPVFGKLKHLTRILLRGGDDHLTKLPKLQQLTSLQILDLSGTTKFNNFSFKDSIAELNHLKVLNLSKTRIIKLPAIPRNLSELILSGCSELVELPSITSLNSLELLDVSHTPKLVKINPEFFQHLKYLRCLNLLGCSALQEIDSVIGDLEIKMPYLKIIR